MAQVFVSHSRKGLAEAREQKQIAEDNAAQARRQKNIAVKNEAEAKRQEDIANFLRWGSRSEPQVDLVHAYSSFTPNFVKSASL